MLNNPFVDAVVVIVAQIVIVVVVVVIVIVVGRDSIRQDKFQQKE
jgi:hypothetical protein